MQAASLAPAEGVYVFLLVGRREQEALQVLHRCYAGAFAEVYVFGQLCHGVNHAFVSVEANSVLAVVTEAYGFAEVP